MMMNLLKDKSKNIQFEAFHVFKVRPSSLSSSSSRSLLSSSPMTARTKADGTTNEIGLCRESE